jgi:hypothetical protein
MQSHEGGYFIRLTVLDRTGVFASVATRMAENDISLESIVQRSKQHLAPIAPPDDHPRHPCDDRGVGAQGRRRDQGPRAISSASRRSSASSGRRTA